MIASGQVVEDVFRKLSKRCAHAQLVMDMRRDFEKENGLDGSDCIVVTGIQLESGAREETGRFRDVKRCVATEDRTRVSGISLLRHNR